MIEPALAKEPMLRKLAKEPMDPIESVDPTEPIESTELRDPMLRIEFVEPMLQRELWSVMASSLMASSLMASSSRGLHALLAQGLLKISRVSLRDEDDGPAMRERPAQCQEVSLRFGINDREARSAFDASP